MQILYKKMLELRFLTAAFLLLAGWAGVSLQPPYAGAGEPVSIGKTNLEPITVTAQKRKENVREVTTSITVLTDTAIEEAQIESTEEIWRYVPNLFTSHEGSRDYFYRIKIRGISNTAYGDPATALYIDDVSYAGVYAFNAPMFDIERVEVLKGPQGTLYGKSTEGGAINIVTKSPDNDIDAKVKCRNGSLEQTASERIHQYTGNQRQDFFPAGRIVFHPGRLH